MPNDAESISMDANRLSSSDLKLDLQPSESSNSPSPGKTELVSQSTSETETETETETESESSASIISAQPVTTEGNKRELVVFSENDPEDARNWSEWKKRGVVANICILSFVVVFGSASYAPGEGQVRLMFNASEEVASLGLTVYVLGFAFGPLLWGPMSEMYGRRLPYMISWPLLIASTALSAWVENLPVILIFRFFTGCFAGCPLNNGTGIISDLYASNPRKLQKGVGLYAFTALCGPVFGSLAGFFIAANLTNGLWVIRIHWFMTIAVWPFVLILPETYGPAILTNRARRLRKEGGKNVNAFAAHEEVRRFATVEVVKKNIGRPFAMLLIEPIVIGAAVWVALSYSIIYFFFEVFPIVFVEQNHFRFQFGGLPFLGITFGMIVCLVTTDRLTQVARRVRIPFVDPPPGPASIPAGRGGGGEGEGEGEEEEEETNAPEANLKVVLVACILTPISLFWFAWTSTGNVHWISPALAGVLFGYSMLGTFYAFSAYATQIFTTYASSASASNTLFRSIVASIFPIIAHPILDGLGTTWGVSLFGFLSLGLLPIPLIFIRYGPALREKSYFGREAREIMVSLRRDNWGGDYDGVDGGGAGGGGGDGGGDGDGILLRRDRDLPLRIDGGVGDRDGYGEGYGERDGDREKKVKGVGCKEEINIEEVVV